MKKIIKIFIILSLLIFPIRLVFSASENQVLINNGELSVDSRDVKLDIKVEKNIDKISISNSKDFLYSTRLDYKNSIEWDLCSRYSGVIKLPVCDDGEYIVYVKLYDKSREEVETVSAKVLLTNAEKKKIVDNSKVEIEKDSNKDIEPVVLAPDHNENLKFDGVDFVRDLKIGSSSPDVKVLQQFLNNNNFIISKSGIGSPGKETDYFGSLSAKALTLFQKKYHNKINTNNFGVLDKATRNFINSINKKEQKKVYATKAVFSRNFGINDKGEDVTRLQKLLASDKTLYPEGIVSGLFGAITKKAVERFQIKYKIINSSHPAYGYVGPATRAKLKEVFSNS